MAVQTDGPVGRKPLRPLSKRDIDRCVEHVLAEVVVGFEPHREGGDDAVALRPRWISSAKLVNRMRRFLVFN